MTETTFDYPLKISVLRARRLAIVALLCAEKRRQQARETEAKFYGENAQQPIAEPGNKMSKLLARVRWFFLLVCRPFDEVDDITLYISPLTAWKVACLFTRSGKIK